MTIARDKNGAVVGQVLGERASLQMKHGPRPLVLLTREGRYVTVPASSVRLEEVR